VKKVFFFDFSELHQVPYGTPKKAPKNSKMIHLSTHNTCGEHFEPPVGFAELRIAFRMPLGQN
jgi:hypothetical protein